MLNDEEYLKMMIALPKSGTIKIESHPKEVIDVDPEIIFNMKARLKDEAFVEQYGLEDQRINELALYREREKIKEVFSSVEDVYRVYSSIKLIREAKQELLYLRLDYTLLAKYAGLKTRGEMVDEADLFAFFLGRKELMSKADRVKGFDFDCYVGMGDVTSHYLSTQLDFFGVSKEVIQSSSRLVLGFKQRKLSSIYEGFLKAFYRRVYG